jgi:hypothetical protein
VPGPDWAINVEPAIAAASGTALISVVGVFMWSSKVAVVGEGFRGLMLRRL